MGVVITNEAGKVIKRFVQWGPANIDVLRLTEIGAFNDGDTMVMVILDNSAEDGTKGTHAVMIDMGTHEAARKVYVKAVGYLAANQIEAVPSSDELRRIAEASTSGVLSVREDLSLVNDRNITDANGLIVAHSVSEGDAELFATARGAILRLLDDVAELQQGRPALTLEPAKPEPRAMHWQVWDAARMSDHIPERWDAHGCMHKLWSEDDARPPDAETVQQAWTRLFGVHPEDETVLAKADHGDAFASLYSRGRVLWHACDGAYIEQLIYMPDPDEKAARDAARESGGD